MFSTNAGASWTASKINSLDGSEATIAAIAPSNSNILYVGGRTGSYTALLYRSTNGGAGWTAIMNGFPSPPQAIAVDTQDPDIVFIACYGGLWRTANGGTSWTKCTLPVDTWGLKAVDINKNNPNQVFAGSTDGVFYSQDRGLTWSNISQGLTVPAVSGLSFNPTNKTLYAGTEGGGLWKRAI